jgi:hypothetical protein
MQVEWVETSRHNDGAGTATSGHSRRIFHVKTCMRASTTLPLYNTCSICDHNIRHVDIQSVIQGLDLVNRLAMSAAVDTVSVTQASPLSNNLSSLVQYATSIAEQTMAAQVANSDPKTNMWGAVGRFMLFLLSIIPGILFWLITFTTITLPTWLFTLFSTSLTFTMNATTLYVFSIIKP